MATKKPEPMTDVQKLALRSARSRLGLTMLLKDAYRQLDESRKRITELEDALDTEKVALNHESEERANCDLDLKARDGEIAFWMEDSDYYRGQLLEIWRERAMRATGDENDVATP